MKRNLRHIWQEIAKRGSIIIAVLLLGVSVLLIWFLATGFSQAETTISIGIATVSAVFSAISSIASLIQATEIQRQRENQERPYITAYFEGTNRGAAYLEVQNAGNSPARDIIFKFEPEPIDFAGRKLGDVSLFKKPISFMPQGKIYRQIIDASYKFLAEGKPTKYKIRITYTSISGQLFDESTDFDLDYLKQATMPGKTVEENLEDISNQMKEIKDVFKRAQGMNSFLVETPKEYEARYQEIVDQHKQLSSWKIILRNLLEATLKKINE